MVWMVTWDRNSEGGELMIRGGLFRVDKGKEKVWSGNGFEPG